MIYVHRNNRQEGPYPDDLVRQKVLAKELALTDLGWREGTADWKNLGELLDIKMPPPLPTAPSGTGSMLIPVLAAGLGLFGAFLDLYVGNAVLTAIEGLKAEVERDHPLVQMGLHWLYDTYGEHGLEIAVTGAHILIACGIVGGLAAAALLVRRYTKVFSALLIICGIVPMFHHRLEFVGLPMALAGLLALFNARRTRLLKYERASSP